MAGLASDTDAASSTVLARHRASKVSGSDGAHGCGFGAHACEFRGLRAFSGTVLAQKKRASSRHATAPVYVVSKPTLISSIVVTPAEVDSSGEANEALSDYQWYIGRAIAVLKPHGVEVYVTNDSTVRWRDELGTHSMSASDSGGVLYLFVSPNGGTRVLRNGVQIDDAILDAARQLFGPIIPPAENRTEKP